MIPGEEGEGISHDPWGGGGYHIRVPMLLSPQIC